MSYLADYLPSTHLSRSEMGPYLSLLPSHRLHGASPSLAITHHMFAEGKRPSWSGLLVMILR